jgi:NAD-reducing hydrogenase large subunit
MKRLTIEPITRIEGHGKITIQLGDDGKVAGAHFHVTQIRGFEKFVEGRPYYEMPSITSRICGICPVSHLLASAKACDMIMGVRIPPTAVMLRQLVHYAQIIQSHALSFFHLSAPDLLLGMDSDPAKRNIFGLAEKHPEVARDGIALRKFGQRVIEGLSGERIHGSWIVPGGVNRPLDPEVRDEILSALPDARQITRRALDLFKSALDGLGPEMDSFGTTPSMFAGLVDPAGDLELYDGLIRFKNPDGRIEADVPADASFSDFIGEASVPYSYMKAPYLKPLGYPNGVYRVGPLARLNVANDCGTPDAAAELAEFRQRFGRVVESSFHYHYARLIEIVYCLERIRTLLDTRGILDSQVRARAGVNAPEGIGIIEAPRGLLIHHYKVEPSGAMKRANLIVATGHNSLAIDRSVEQVAKKFVDGDKLREGMLNRVSAVVRAFDPCLSCSTHAAGIPALAIKLVNADGEVVDEIRN